MDILIILGSMAMFWFSTWSETARAATLIVSNQQQTRGNVPIYVTCDQLRMSKSVPLGQKTLVDIPGNATAIEGKVWRPTTCVGTFYEKAHFTRDERLYVLYDSDKDKEKCKDACFIVVGDDGFYRWDEGKRKWGTILPIVWIP